MKKLYIDDDLHRKLKVISSKKGITLQDLADEMVKEYLKKEKVKK